MDKKAVFHKSCIARYNKQQLNRKRKREEFNEDVSNSKSNALSVENTLSST